MTSKLAVVQHDRELILHYSHVMSVFVWDLSKVKLFLYLNRLVLEKKTVWKQIDTCRVFCFEY